MTNPMVSVIIPVYNAGAYIDETIHSVLSQSYSNWELILVNDGSSDDSEAIIKRYCVNDNRINYTTKMNGGQASARNLGLQKAKGEFVAFLDADDIWHPEKLNEQLKIFNCDPEIGICFTGGDQFTSDVNSCTAYPKWLSGKLSGKSWIYEIYTRSGIINSSVVARKELFDLYGNFDESDVQRGTEDADMWLKLAMAGVVFYGIENPLVYYRNHPNGIHNDKERMLRGKLSYYNKYDADERIHIILRKRQYRYVYRELMNVLMLKGKTDEIKSTFRELLRKDPRSFASVSQRFIASVFSIPRFMWWSNHIVYRIAYRIEKINYYLRGI